MVGTYTPPLPAGTQRLFIVPTGPEPWRVAVPKPASVPKPVSVPEPVEGPASARSGRKLCR